MDRERDKIERALRLFRAGDAAGAERLLRKVVDRNPTHFDALYRLGALLHRMRRPEEAVRYLSRAARAQPENPDVHNMLGVALFAANKAEEALERFDAAVGLAPTAPEALINRANVLAFLERFDAAAADYEAAIDLDRGFLLAYLRLAEIHLRAGSMERALAIVDAALMIDPSAPDVRCVRGNVLSELERFEEALADYDRAVAADPTVAGFHLNRAQTLSELGRCDEALQACDRAIALAPGAAEGYVEKATLLRRMDRLEESFAAFNKALALDARCEAAYAGRAANLLDAGFLKDALRDYDALAELRGDPNHFIELRGFIRRQMCDWSLVPAELDRIEENLRQEKEMASAFAVISVSHSESVNLAAARLASAKPRPEASAPTTGPRRSGEKIRVGYFSADFHDHATTHLLIGVLERADRERFELIGFSFGPDREDAYRARIAATFDAFHDVRALSDAAVARMARDAGLDIAVDLKGLTKGGRSGIFAFRAAPIQLGYLGYPASMGADYMDYIAADRTVVSKVNRAGFCEKIIYLPEAYQPNDPEKAISGEAVARAGVGLPPDAFVYCCFNNSYKILPDVFDVWMRILRSAPGSVLWLIADNEWAPDHLRREAQARGVEPARLIFSPRIALPEHLARCRLADLFLDTSPYNAHTTASDALFAGVPVVACLGRTFAGRVAASLLKAVGLPELVAGNLAEYEALAIDLASQPERLAAIRARLSEQGRASALFDAGRYARHLEKAFVEVCRRRRDGLPPADIFVEPED